MNLDSQIAILSESLVNELVGAVGLPKTAFWHNLFWRLSRKVTDRLANIGATFDRIVGEDGLPAGAAWGLTHFCNPIRSEGGENIPIEGPLLVASNHPGAYDGLVVFSKLVRRDIQWISTEIPFFEHLPHTRSHMLFSSRTDALNRMSVMRSAIRHLQAGGVLVYFGAGHRDPDPATYPGARAMLDNWLEGIDFFFKHVPGLRLLPTVVSGVVSEKWSRSPITLLRRRQIDKQRLSEFGQVITQLLAPGKLMLSPRVSFGPTATEADLRKETIGESLLPAVIAREKSLLEGHCRTFGGNAS